MAFKCGHCGNKHDKAEEALKCFNQRLEARRNAVGDAQTGTMRPDAQEFLASLLRQFGYILENDMTPETVPWQDGKKVIHDLVNARRLKAQNKPWAPPSGVLSDPKARTSPASVKRPTRGRRGLE